ncbi:MAG: formate--tetrahydrofolate ligase, partial [Cyclobacteriaceae bacterium]|nr:formate--tetrahydrofolate ligase [Cyclobacteriaceae bacterium]
MTDIEIAQSVSPKHIREVASIIGISEEVLEFYGKYKAKIPLS